MKDPGIEFNSDPIPEAWRQAYLKRPIEKLPADLVRACDELRAQRRDIDMLRGQLVEEKKARAAAEKRLWWEKAKNLALAGVLGAASLKGLEVAFVAVIAFITKK